MFLLILLMFVVAANFFDYISTKYALLRGAVEKNPLVKKNVDLVKLVGTIVQMVFVAAAYRADETTGIIVTAFIVVLFCSIAIHNVIVAEKNNKLF